MANNPVKLEKLKRKMVNNVNLRHTKKERYVSREY